MLAVLPFPNISPEIFSISIFGLHIAPRWYAMAYIAGILIGWYIAVQLVKRPRLWAGEPPMTREQIDEMVTYVVLGIVLGGRLAYVIFYKPAEYLAHPLDIFKLWQGGMSFHGGMLGVAVAAVLFWRRHRVPLMPLADILAVATPPGLMFGRIANFINDELWGRPSQLPWAVVFPNGVGLPDCPLDAVCARHPSQLYEAALEGLLLGSILLYLAFRSGALKRPALLTGVFLAGYAVARITVEFFRLADAQFITPDDPYGHVIRFGGGYGLTMGQTLSVPMFVVGVGMIVWALRRARA